MKHSKYMPKNMNWKLFFFLFSLSTYGLFQYNRLEANTFNMETHQKITKLYDTIRKATPFYLNTLSVEMEQGVHMLNGVSVMVNETGKIKQLSSGINLLEEEIKLNVGEGYWGITLLQKSATNVNNAHVKPLGDVHIDLNSKYKFDENWINRILENEKMLERYQAFSQCDLKFTEPYVEKYSLQKIRTIFYPMYVNKSLEAMVLIDLKDDVFTHWLNDFNNKRKTFLSYRKSGGLFIQKESITIPCAPIDNQLTISINMVLILCISLIFSFMMIVIVFSIESLLSHFFNHYAIDQMTGLYRRDYHENKLNRTSGKSVIIVDIDHFKNINDEHGHLKGDLVIKEVCKRLQKNVRQNDVAIRWGGEEFVIVLNHISHNGLLNRIEDIRHSICRELIEGMNVTVSIGATTGHAFSFKKAFKLADKALYQAKNSGRNRAILMEDVK
ncbi:MULTISPECIES: GGDEF domain-containing protein [Aliivibrio]|uniref:diguanylate cyclase n=1 Tax=Aliivibrio finisterrensis TaxID=511998 RepID=A0A4Q5KZN4_9GAMM|nr:MULTISPECIES: GGDEF domain-containing protein [Aliivibrio]MDD9177291.1 GGDEF domain-containing protein [Aliivibrio sp. A6]RYU54778.1 GGDEF domain-containing protein [Aliivibrio finisterrensis]RYU56452.1 GGDEF domain-containing protein [Aliivibrio finisterrensis]RYU61573.1 GGDEF domain-containing protein [Aliivibrio finisterrensis]RYU66838.1 GGDEF domain-containing protein [Aliivibrio finisterrensis]